MAGHGARLEELDGGSVWARWFLEQPTGVVVGLVVLGGGAWWVMRRQGKGRAGAMALGGSLTLAAGVWVLAALVMTTREELMMRTRRLVDAVAKGDASGVDGLTRADLLVRVGEAARASGGGGGAEWGGAAGMNKPRVLEVVEKEVGGGGHHVVVHAVGRVEAQVDGPGAARTRVHVDVSADESGGVAVGMSWMLTWARSGTVVERGKGDWVVVRAEVEEVGW